MIDEQKSPQDTLEYPEKTANIAPEAENQQSLHQEEHSPAEMAGEAAAEAPQQPEVVIAALQEEIVTLQEQLQEQSQQLETFKSQYVRIAADFENVRKRQEKEKEEIEHRVKRDAISELLTAIDSFERARIQIKPADEGEMVIHKSYQGVYKQIVDGLKRIGVSAMRPEGEPFDPNFHEAVFQEPNAEYPEGTVIEQLVRGYLLGDRVLRHAMVKVAVAPEPQQEKAEENSAAPAGETAEN